MSYWRKQAQLEQEETLAEKLAKLDARLESVELSLAALGVHDYRWQISWGRWFVAVSLGRVKLNARIG